MFNCFVDSLCLHVWWKDYSPSVLRRSFSTTFLFGLSAISLPYPIGYVFLTELDRRWKYPPNTDISFSLHFLWYWRRNEFISYIRQTSCLGGREVLACKTNRERVWPSVTCHGMIRILHTIFDYTQTIILGGRCSQCKFCVSFLKIITNYRSSLEEKQLTCYRRPLICYS